jgi:hypothetical protein
VSDFQGLIAEDGQLYIIDPMGIVMSPQNTKRNTDQVLPSIRIRLINKYDLLMALRCFYAKRI